MAAPVRAAQAATATKPVGGAETSFNYAVRPMEASSSGHDVPMHYPPPRTTDLTRRIRDLLRADIVARRYEDGALPSEEELRAEYSAPRSSIREALESLQDEGLILRVRGQGTFVKGSQFCHSISEAHGMEEPADESIWHGRMTTKIIDWSTVAATPPVARMLDIPVGTAVLHIDYIALVGKVAIGQGTNHLVFPEAQRLSPDLLRVDFYEMLRAAGVAVGESTFLFDASVADEYDVELFGSTLGDPVMAVEQIIYAADGRPLDVCFGRSPKKISFLSLSASAR